MPIPLVIFHSNCLDGFGSAYAAFAHFDIKLGTCAEYLPAAHGDTPPDTSGRTVYLLDYVYKRAAMETLCRKAQRVNVEPIMEELARFVEQGKVGVIGASNWHHARVAAANDYAQRTGLPPYAAVSAHFGLVPWAAPPWPGACQLSGPAHADARDFYTAAQLPVFIWASLAFGFFADAYDPRAPRATFRSRWIARSFGSEANHARLERVRQYARERGLSAAQVALAFSLNQSFPTHCIVGCSTRGKLADCVAALGVRLEPEAIGSLLRE